MYKNPGHFSKNLVLRFFFVLQLCLLIIRLESGAVPSGISNRNTPDTEIGTVFMGESDFSPLFGNWILDPPCILTLSIRANPAIFHEELLIYYNDRVLHEFRRLHQSGRPDPILTILGKSRIKNLSDDNDPLFA